MLEQIGVIAMSETRIHRIAQKEWEIQQKIENYEFLLKLEQLLVDIEELNEEEKRVRKIEYDNILQEREKELSKQIEIFDNKYSGKAWDFSKERILEVFSEDDEIILCDYKESELDKYIQIQLENGKSIELYTGEELRKSAWNTLYNENSFCCEIIRKSDKEFLGYVAIKDTRSNLWEISIELLKENCNKGYGTKAIQLFLPKISQITSKKQFQALVETDNIPSQKLMEKLGARLIDIYDFTFHGDEQAAENFEEKHLDMITDRMIELAKQIDVEPRKMLSHVLDYRFFIKEGKIAKSVTRKYV